MSQSTCWEILLYFGPDSEKNYFEYRRYYCFLIVLPERQFSVKKHDCVTVSHPVPSFPFISIFECGTRQIEKVLGLIPKHMWTSKIRETETITKTLFSRDTLYVSLKTINTQNQLLIAFMKYFFDNLNLSKACYGAKLQLLMSQSKYWAIFFILARREKQYRWYHLHWLKGHSWQRGSFQYNLCSSTCMIR